MSPEKSREYLRLHDSGDGADSPPDLDYRAAVLAIESLKSLCEAILNIPLAVNTSFQDSTKLASISSATNLSSCPILEFSNFGKIFTIRPDLCDTAQASTLAHAIESRGYVYISWDILREPYKGNIEWADPEWIWHTRFFDYQ